MPLIGGKPHTQLLNLNVLDELRVDGVLVSTGAANLTVGQVPKSDGSGGLIYAGATVNVATGEWTFDQSINVPTASINLGQVITLSEGTNALLDRDNVTGTNRAHVRSTFTNSGSLSPQYFKLGTQVNFVVSSDFSQTITTNPLLFQITSVGDVQVNVLHFKTGTAMANVRIRIKDNVTGIVLRFLPDESSWNTGLNGFAFISGDNLIDLVSVATSTPGVINLGLAPFRFNNTQVLDIEVRATAVNLLGNVSSFPFLNVDQQAGVDTTLPEVATGFSGTQGSVLFMGASSQINEDNTNLFFDDAANRLKTGALSVIGNNITLGDVTTPTDVTADGGGFTLKGTTDKTITWVDATNKWTFNQGVDLGTNSLFVNDIQSQSGLALEIFSNNNIDINTGSGVLEITTGSGDLELKTTSGRIRINDASTQITLKAGITSPEGVRTGDPGDVFFRKSTTTSGIYVHRGAATGNTGWFDLVGEAGDVSKIGTPVDNQIAVWTGDGTLEGTIGLNFDSSVNTLTLRSAVSGGATVVFNDNTNTFKALIGISDASGELSIRAANQLVIASDDNITITPDVLAGTVNIGSNAIIAYRATNQVTFGTSDTPDVSAVVEIKSTIKGFLQPKQTTTQRDEITGVSVVISQTDVANGTGIITKAAHGFVVGDSIILRNKTGTSPSEFADGTKFISVTSFTSGQYILQNTNGNVGTDITSVTAGTYTINMGVPPASGLSVYNTITNTPNYFNGTSWLDYGGNVISVGTPVDNQVGVWTGDGTLEGSPNLTFDGSNLTVGGNLTTGTDALLVDAGTNQVKIGDTAAGLTDLTIFQNSGSVNKGITLSGAAATGASSTTEGVTLQAGFLVAGNTQLWVTNKADLGNAAKNSFRYIVGGDVPIIVGITNTGSANKSLAFGINIAGAHCGFGFPTSVVQADIQAQVHVNTGLASIIGLIVQASAGQSASVFQTRNSAGTGLSAIDMDDNWGLGTLSPSTKLHVNSLVTDTTAVVTTQSNGANPGITAKHVGNRDPQGNVTAAGGAEYYRDSGTTSGTYESREATTGTNWLKRSLVGLNTFEIHSSAELDELATAGTITISSSTLLILKGSIVTTNVFVLSGGASLHFSSNLNRSANIVYTGTGTLISGTGSVRCIGMAFIGVNNGSTFINLIDGSFSFDHAAIIDFDNLGTITGGLILHEDVSYINALTGFNLININSVECIIVGYSGSDLPGPVFTINTNVDDAVLTFTNAFASNVTTAGSLLDLSTNINNTAVITIRNSGAESKGNLFKQSILTDATINSVADGTISNGTITAQASNGSGGTTHSSTTTYFEDEEVTITGTTSYNGPFQIFNVVAGVSFDTITTFVANDATGTVATVRLSITLAVGHGITTGNNLKIIDSNFYNGFETALNIATNVLTVNGTFIANDTGKVERQLSIDQTDPRVKAFLNFRANDSQTIAFCSENSNSTATTITDGTYVELAFSNIIINQVTEGFRLVTGTRFKFEYIRKEPFSGVLTGAASFVKSGSTANYRIAMSTNGVVPVFATAPYVPIEVKTTKVTQPLEFSAVLSQGDTIELFVAGDGTGDNITGTDVIGDVK